MRKKNRLPEEFSGVFFFLFVYGKIEITVRLSSKKR